MTCILLSLAILWLDRVGFGLGGGSLRVSELEVWTSRSEDGILFWFVVLSSPSVTMVFFLSLVGGISLAKATLPFLVERATLAASSSDGQPARVFFLGGIMGLVFIAQTMGVKCWAY